MAIYKEERMSIPEGCTVELNGKKLKATGPNGVCEKDLSHIMMLMDKVDGDIRLRLWNGKKIDCAKLGTAASVVKSMINGVNKGFEYHLKAAYKHFPISMEIEEEGKLLKVKNFMGEKSTRNFIMRGQSKVEFSKEKDTLIITGSDINDVSQSAGSIQNYFRPKNLDMRIFMDGIYINKKGIVE